MSEPDGIVSPYPQSEKSSLWNESPSWRNLTIVAAMLTTTAIAFPLSLPESTPLKTDANSHLGQQPDVCRLTLPTVPGPPYRGTVTSFVDPATSMAQIKMIEAQAGGRIDPAYIDRQRIRARADNGSSYFFFVPPTLEVHVGDRVILQGWYRNENLPCNYVPNYVISNLGPADDTRKAPTRGNTEQN
jgi:hypothetical protein